MFQEMLKKTGKKFLKKGKKRNILLAALAAVLILSLLLYSSDWFMFDFVDRVNQATLNHSVVDNARHIALNIGDEINPFMAFGIAENPNIQEYSLTLSVADLKHFKDASEESVKTGYKTEAASDYRKIELEYEGKTYDVKMALFGDRPDNYIFGKKSFKIKTEKEEYINGKRRLNFVLPENRGFAVTIFEAELAKKLGLFPPEYKMAEVNINGVSQGLFFVEEGLDQEYTERNQEPGTIILQHTDNWVEDHPIQQSNSLHWKIAGIVPPGGYDYSAGVINQTGHNTPFDLDISNFEEIDSLEEKKINYRLFELLKAVEENNQDVFEELIDIDNVSSIEALRALFGNVHNFTGDNLRLF
ncbi:CotH kinase family protein, partial [bacterium]|nr:CotH kinase family protein [bacterium]